MTAAHLLAFYRGHGTDHADRTLDQIHRFDLLQLEAVHDYIQWLFPLPERSGVNPHAPRLTEADIAAFAAEPALRAQLRTSLDLMLEFWGMTIDSDDSIRPSTDFAARAANWLTPHNHNYLRITRVIRSLALLGLGVEAGALHDAVQQIAEAVGLEVISDETREYWRRAIQTDSD